MNGSVEYKDMPVTSSVRYYEMLVTSSVEYIEMLVANHKLLCRVQRHASN